MTKLRLINGRNQIEILKKLEDEISFKQQLTKLSFLEKLKYEIALK